MCVKDIWGTVVLQGHTFQTRNEKVKICQCSKVLSLFVYSLIVHIFIGSIHDLIPHVKTLDEREVQLECLNNSFK